MQPVKSYRNFFGLIAALAVLFLLGTLAGVDLFGFVNHWGQGRDNLELTDEATLPVQGQPSQMVSDTVTLNVVGDVMLARKVGRLIEANGIDYPLRFLGSELAAGDITFANLESPIAKSGTPLPGKQICFQAAPSTLESLKLGGFDVVSLANNHALDYDAPALLETIDLLSQSGIKSVGAGVNITSARQPVIVECKGIKIAFLAYSDLAEIFFSQKYPRAHRATEQQSGVAPLEEKSILEDIRIALQQADIVAVSLHWGTEYTDQPTKEQREMARHLIDAGADLILGHHPHWLQGLEIYQGKLIAYSLGNFVFDQNWAEPTREGLVLQVEVDHEGVKQARVRPVFIQESQPQWATEARQQKLLQQVVSLCGKLSTPVQIEGDWIKFKIENNSTNKATINKASTTL